MIRRTLLPVLTLMLIGPISASAQPSLTLDEAVRRFMSGWQRCHRVLTSPVAPRRCLVEHHRKTSMGSR
jgi:hypothetical protein